MPTKTNDLIEGLKVVLGEVTVLGQKPIKKIKPATEIDVAFIRRIPDNQVLSLQTREYDGENAELGTQELFLDVWAKDLSQDAGGSQLTEDDKLEAISQACREQAGHLSGGPFGAGTDLVRIEPAIKVSPDDQLFAFRLRLTYAILWG